MRAGLLLRGKHRVAKHPSKAGCHKDGRSPACSLHLRCFMQGANAPFSGLIAMLAAAQIVGRGGGAADFTRHIVFAGLAGETWGEAPWLPCAGRYKAVQISRLPASSSSPWS